MTQQALADKIGVSAKTISKWETARGLPDISLLQPLAQALGVSLPELLEEGRVYFAQGEADATRQQAAQEEEPNERQRSHWADRPGENEIDYAAVETVFEPSRASLPEDYVPGALGADGQAQRIAAPESVEGEVPFGEVYAAYYAAFLQEQLPTALRETAADYLMNLK